MYKQNNIMIDGGSRQQSSLLYQQELQQKHQKKKKGYMRKIKIQNTKKRSTQVASKETEQDMLSTKLTK